MSKIDIGDNITELIAFIALLGFIALIIIFGGHCN